MLTEVVEETEMEFEKMPLTEKKFSDWRVVATDADGKEHVIFIGQSFTAVTQAFPNAFKDLLEEEDKAKIKEVMVQKWYGTASKGTWADRKLLPIP